MNKKERFITIKIYWHYYKEKELINSKITHKKIDIKSIQKRVKNHNLSLKEVKMRWSVFKKED